jgi:Domain of unknown function (DUF5658)
MPRYVIALAMLLAAAPAGAQSLEKQEFTAPPIFTMAVNVKPLPPPKLMMPLYSSFAALSASDVYLTWLGMHHGAVEANPLVAPIARNASGLAAFKVATGAATFLAVERLRRDHPRAAVWMLAAANGGMMWVVWHNAQVAGVGR